MIMILSNNYLLRQQYSISTRHEICNLFIFYLKFVIHHSAKAYLGPFQASMMDFFCKKFNCRCMPKMRNAFWKNTFELKYRDYQFWIEPQFFQLISFTVLPYLETSGPKMHCTAILYIAFPGFFKGISQMWSHNSCLIFYCNSQEKADFEGKFG